MGDEIRVTYNLLLLFVTIISSLFLVRAQGSYEPLTITISFVTEQGRCGR